MYNESQGDEIMRSKKVVHLYENLRRKGISYERGDIKYLRNYSYYQIINAYKPLFITNVKNIDEIKEDLINKVDVETYLRIFNKESLIGQTGDTIFYEICKVICQNYEGIHNGKPVIELEKIIKKKKYLLHIYDNDTELRDFVRLYQFEHSLRNLLLKYILRTEEDIKNIFCSTLNDRKLDSNFLLDINNYNVSEDNSIRTLIKVIKKHHNKYSNPISRKRSQNIIPPFWILINELSLGELMHTISSLKDEYKNIVLDSLVKQFTTVESPSGRDRNAMMNLLSDISAFRNDLAHNNPIFQYNIWGNCLKHFPTISYIKPKITNAPELSQNEIRAQQNNRKQQIQSDLKRFWGSNAYTNQSVTTFNIDLSYIMYLMFKFTVAVDSNTKYKENLKRIFTKYKIIDIGSWGTCNDYEGYTNNMAELKEIKRKVSGLATTPHRSIQTTKELKSLISSTKKELQEINKRLKRISEAKYITPDNTKENSFPFLNAYTKYTGIDVNFLENQLI